jgi:hypothetical protein
MPTDNLTPSARWAVEFADRFTELASGQAVYHDLLDRAYELWPANAHRPAPEVADEEWAAYKAAHEA